MFQDEVDLGKPFKPNQSPGVRYIAADVARSLSIMPLGDDSGMIGVEPGNYDRRYARRLQGNIANRNLMRSWLHRCMVSHTACQEIEQGVRRRMRGPKRLLNTKTMCVELVDWESRYLALSYVWGDVPQPSVHGFGDDPFAPKSFSIHDVVLPPTILDAIRLTNELGETYLWVDLLCIDQDNPIEKAAEIAQMNEVYLAATATIVALCSTDANSGLPGVDEYRPPRAQRTETFEGIGLATVHPSPSEIMSQLDCTWNNRIWTMQEHLLSRRLLFLGPKQASFSCSRSSYSEDRYDSDHETYEVHHHPGGVLLDVGRKFGDVPWHVWKTYTELYSTRNGSADADRFLAFQGILNEQQRNGKISFAEGLDISHLPLALYWWHGSSRDSRLFVQSRRMSVSPSWSWVGWSGQVYFPNIDHYRAIVKEFLLKSRAGDRLLLYDETGDLLASDTEQHSNHTTSSPPPIGQDNDQATDTQDASGLHEGQQQSALIFEGRCIIVDSHCASSKSLRGYIQVSGYQTLPAPESHRQPSPINPPTSTFTAAQKPNPDCICVLLGTSPIWSPGIYLRLRRTGQMWPPSIYLRPSSSFHSAEVPPKAFAPNRAEESALSRYKSFFDGRERYVGENPRRLGGKYSISLIVMLLSFASGLGVMACAWICWSISIFSLLIIRQVLASVIPDFFTSAHLLRLEDVGDGFYERRGVQEMHYPKFKRMKPEMRTIKLI